MPVLRPGDRAPDVTLPAADREGIVSLMDYRGKQPVLLALFRGLYCPFCRRQMSQLAMSVPLCVLYFMSIGLAYFFGKRPSKEQIALRKSQRKALKAERAEKRKAKSKRA